MRNNEKQATQSQHEYYHLGAVNKFQSYSIRIHWKQLGFR